MAVWKRKRKFPVHVPCCKRLLVHLMKYAKISRKRTRRSQQIKLFRYQFWVQAIRKFYYSYPYSLFYLLSNVADFVKLKDGLVNLEIFQIDRSSVFLPVKRSLGVRLLPSLSWVSKFSTSSGFLLYASGFDNLLKLYKRLKQHDDIYCVAVKVGRRVLPSSYFFFQVCGLGLFFEKIENLTCFVKHDFLGRFLGLFKQFKNISCYIRNADV